MININSPPLLLIYQSLGAGCALSAEGEPALPRPDKKIPLAPALLAQGLRLMPLAPLSLALTRVARKVVEQHPGLIRRLGPHDRTRFVIDPTDLPFVLQLDPGAGRPTIRVARGPGAGAARIAGPLSALLGLVHGAFDGDALFFSRDLMIEGDTDAVLALRNAIDDAELDLSEDIALLAGPLAATVRRAVAFAERRTGLCLTRPDEAAGW